MCGLPTETDEDVLEIADLAVEVIKAGREASGQKDIRCTVSIGGFVPKPHTPFQWAGQASAETIDHRLRVLRQKINEDRRIGRSIGLRYHDGKPGVIEGLLSRGDRRVGRVIERVWRDGGKFDGWSEHFSFDRWTTAAAEELAPFGVDLDWFTTRERTEHEVLPWDHLDSGLDKEFLWDDWQDALTRGGGRRLPVDPLLRLRRLPDHGHRDPDRPDRAQPAPAHRRLMARQPDGPPPPPTVQKLRIRYAKRGPAAVRLATATSPAPSSGRCGGPRCRWRSRPGSARTRRSPTSAPRPTGAASEAEYLEIGLSRPLRPRGACGPALDAALPDGGRRPGVRRGGGGDRLAGRPDRHLGLAGRAARRDARRAAAGGRGVPRQRRRDRRQAHQERPQGHRRARGRGQRVGGRGGRLCHTAHGRPAADARCTTRRRVGRPGCRRRPAPAVAPPGRA